MQAYTRDSEPDKSVNAFGGTQMVKITKLFQKGGCAAEVVRRSDAEKVRLR